MSELEKRQELLELSHALIKKGLVVRTWGNFSLLLDDKTFLITPSGRNYEHMKPEDLVRCSVETGKALEGEPFKPSSEAPMHALVYRNRGEIQCVLHTHQIYASAMSLSKREIAIEDKKHQEILGTVSIPISGYALPGTKPLHKNMERALLSHLSDVILMERHGALVMAESSEVALKRAEALEEVCHRAYDYIVGRESIKRESLEVDDLVEDSMMKIYRKELGDPNLVVSADEEVKLLEKASLKPYLDDFAQICGPKVTEHKKKNNVVFGPSLSYAICFGSDEEEARSVRAVLEKNARAAHIARAYNQKAIPAWECHLMRLVYQKKYSKMNK